jgi:beta-glucosidase
MTLDEKIGQMTQADLKALPPDLSELAKYGLGSVLCGGGSDPSPDNLPASWARAHDDCQAQAAKSRLKVPLLFGVDSVHGFNNSVGAVIVPHNVGLGASRDPKVVEAVARLTAEETAATGIRWAFAPCVAVARNERWGRTYESFGEDPALVALLGPAAVKGLQGGASLSADPTSVLACVKHYVGDGGTTDGIDQGNTEVDEATLRKIHLPGYPPSIAAGAGSVMTSYSSWNGQKLHGHKKLVTDLLKTELGFPGLIVSDWAAIDQLPGDYASDIEQSINAGLDMIMIPNGPGQSNNYVEFITKLKALVESGKVPMSRIDDAVLRILTVKAQMGLLDASPKSDPARLAQIGSPEHRAIARDAVRRSVVLLKNENHTLPLSKSLKRIHVAGPAADDIGTQCGGWTIDWQGKAGNATTTGGTTLLDAVKQAVGDGVDVTHSPDASGAAGADAVIVVLAEPPYAEMKGDRNDLSLSEADQALVARAKASGKPVVTVLYSGRPLILGNALKESDAFLAAWLPGTEGAGLADVLFGHYAPTARLPHTWPKSMDQIPINVGDTNRGEPLFPFGFGLSY